MALTDPHAFGATPLRLEEIKGLKHAVTTHGDLNELEAANILQGQEWALGARRTQLSNMLSDDYMFELHKRMFGAVWRWAGKYRLRDTNIGLPFTSIRGALREIYADSKYWIERGSFSPLEIAVRIHHRLVWVHPFSNGNGRFARLFADLLLIRHFKQERLSWSGNALGTFDPRRADYIAALQSADARNYAPLLAFCNSS